MNHYYRHNTAAIQFIAQIFSTVNDPAMVFIPTLAYGSRAASWRGVERVFTLSRSVFCVVVFSSSEK